MSGRRLIWSLAIDATRADRKARPEIREEQLRVSFGRGPILSSWRGRSGRRYVVTVQPIGELAARAGDLVVAIAVSRDADGVARIEHVGSPAMLHRQRERLPTACELHIHSLADDWSELWAAVEDLRP